MQAIINTGSVALHVVLCFITPNHCAASLRCEFSCLLSSKSFFIATWTVQCVYCRHARGHVLKSELTVSTVRRTLCKRVGCSIEPNTEEGPWAQQPWWEQGKHQGRRGEPCLHCKSTMEKNNSKWAMPANLCYRWRDWITDSHSWDTPWGYRQQQGVKQWFTETPSSKVLPSTMRCWGTLIRTDTALTQAAPAWAAGQGGEKEKIPTYEKNHT